MQNLILVDLLGYSDDSFLAFLKRGCQDWLVICLLLKHECRKQAHHFLRLEVSEHIFKHKLCEDKLIRRVDLTSYFPLELHPGVLVNKAKVLEDRDALFIIGKKL